jgi:16S rRNA (cytosine1402-N4)-methyltransferase
MAEPPQHIPVLADKVLELLDPKPGEIYFDGTAGYGGHASLIAERIGSNGHMILIDRDRNATDYLRQRFKTATQIIRRDYSSVSTELRNSGQLVDMALLDLGVSSPQIDIPQRGFSFRNSGPLDMRMDQTAETSAADVVNNLAAGELADIIYRYGEERRSRRIAKAIVDNRPLETTKQLADLVAKTIGRSGDIHPATRTFQALRIYLNDELGQLSRALPEIAGLLKPDGRLAVISFHSLEDRIVKEFINTESRDCICPPEQPFCNCDHHASLRKLTKRPISGATEDALNPRARSAKLRAAVKINQNPKEPK